MESASILHARRKGIWEISPESDSSDVHGSIKISVILVNQNRRGTRIKRQYVHQNPDNFPDVIELDLRVRTMTVTRGLPT